MTTTAHPDFSAAEFVADPYPAVAESRSQGPLLWHEPSGMWLATTHAAVSQALRNRTLGRNPNPHLGFGIGLHFCLGATLPRMELEITLRQLLERFPRWRLRGAAPRWPTWVLRGFERIYVSLEDA